MPLNSTRGAASSKGFGFGSADLLGPGLFTVATGGTITTSGDYKIHTFTGPGAFTVTSVGKGPTNPLGGPNTVSYLVLAGGGNGAGGYREGRDIAPSYTASPLVAPTGLTLTRKENFPITVGAGGNATSSKGSNSVFSTITAAGGGSNLGPAACSTNRSGGSGSGGNGSPQPVLAGNTPPVSPPQGNPGGTNRCGQSNSGGGGAGAEGGGQGGYSGWPFPGPCQQPGGRGGAGTTTSITASPLSYAGGGGGGANAALGFTGGAASPCGTGGRASGSGVPAGDNGTTNRGGGGGTGGGVGGSGVVVIRYKFQ
jgi:hypothetical protein